MSNTYSIACVQCRKHLWIGQGRPQTDMPGCQIYGGDKRTLALRDFLYTHLNHPLIFGDNCRAPIDDYEEIEEAEEQTADPALEGIGLPGAVMGPPEFTARSSEDAQLDGSIYQP